MNLFPTSLSVDTKAPGRTRAKVPLESRKRNPIACEQCRSRKIKCESSNPGEPPCKQCEKTGSECRFGDLSPKVVVPKNDLLLLKSRCEALEQLILDTSTEEQLNEIRTALMAMPMEGTNDEDSGSASTRPSSRLQKVEFNSRLGSEERSPSDNFAYHGLESTSDKLFFERVHQLVNRDSVTRLGSNGLYNGLFPTLIPYKAIGQTTSASYINYPACTRNDVYSVPAKPVVTALIGVFRNAIGCIEGEQIISTGGKSTTCFDYNDPFKGLNFAGATGDEKRNIDMIFATLNCVLAVGAQTVAMSTGPDGDGVTKAQGWSILDSSLLTPTYGTGNNQILGPLQIEPSVYFISKARFLLGNPAEAVQSLPTMQCLILMGIYYWTIGCVQEAYQYVGMAARVAVACGFFDPKKVLLISEEERNVFQRLLIFDRMINNLMGVPSMLPAVEQVNSKNLKTAHIYLLEIAGDFTAKLAEISQLGANAGLQYINLADNAIGALNAWRNDFPQLNNLTSQDRDRPLVALCIQYFQQVLLFSRPSILSILQHSFGTTTYPVHQTCYTHLSVALKTARMVTNLLRPVIYTSPLEIQALTTATMILSLGQLTDYSTAQDLTEVQWSLSFLQRRSLSHARELALLNQDILRVCINAGRLPASTEIPQIIIQPAVSGVPVSAILASNIPAAVSMPTTEADFAARAAATAAAAGMPLGYSTYQGEAGMSVYSWQ